MGGTETQPTRHFVFGVVFLAVVVVISVFVWGMFNRAYEPTVPVTLHAERSGLMMDKGSAVKLRGVVAGRVKEVHVEEDGVRMDLAITPEYLDLIPDNVSAELVAPTVFGAKYVDLRLPAQASGSSLRAGSVIDQTSVSVEVNGTFEHLMTLLETAKPARVNAALTALATALRGRGDQVGRFLDLLEAYLRQLNPSLPDFTDNVPELDEVLSTYADVAPELLDIASDVSETSDTIVAKQAELHAFLLDVTGFADTTKDFLANNADGLVTTLKVLEPTTRLLARYAPALPCTLGGTVVNNGLLEPIMGGAQTGFASTATFTRPQEPYVYPRDLPVVGETDGPKCFGLPRVKGGMQPHHAFNVGPDPYEGDPQGLDPVDFATILFGGLWKAMVQ